MKIVSKVRKAALSTKDITFDNGETTTLPNQHKSQYKFMRDHGCVIVGMYLTLQYLGKEMYLRDCMNYMHKHYSYKGHANYNIKQIADAINKIKGKKIVEYHKSMTEAEVNKALANGKPVIFTEGNPIHTVILVKDSKRKTGVNVARLSAGSIKWRSLKTFLKKKCSADYYKGYVIVKG